MVGVGDPRSGPGVFARPGRRGGGREVPERTHWPGRFRGTRAPARGMWGPGTRALAGAFSRDQGARKRDVGSWNARSGWGVFAGPGRPSTGCGVLERALWLGRFRGTRAPLDWMW